jgi:hypothetical protein
MRKFSDGQPRHGSKEVSQFLAGWPEAWSRPEWAVEDLIEVGDCGVSVRTEAGGVHSLRKPHRLTRDASSSS